MQKVGKKISETQSPENVAFGTLTEAGPAELAGTPVSLPKIFGAATPTVASASSSADAAVNATLVINDTADHVINFNEASNVSFTVSGLNGGGAGTVTFADADHQVVVGVTGNGAYSADLSTLTDGAVTSLLSAADSAGHVTSATGNTVSLDTDSALNPTLTVNAANPAAVAFTVSGLESDYSGTVTFTDATGKADVVPIGSNGTYSANLSNLTNGTITYLMTVSDPAGNVINVDPPITLGPSGYADGALNAPAGTPQLPNLLNGYAAPPPWQVAGVNYAVGMPSGTSLKDPTIAANLPAGAGFNAANNLIYVWGTNVTLNGFDFSLHGGTGVYLTSSATGTVIENSNFAVGANLVTPISAVAGSGDLTVINNNFNGGGVAGNDPTGDLINYNGSGNFVAQYNYIHDSVQHGIDFGGANITPTVEYNLFVNMGMAAGSHPDPWYFYGAGINNGLFAFNTVYETQAVAAANWGIVLDGDTGVTLSNTIASNNTVISTGPSLSMSYVFGIVQSTGGTLTNNAIQNNYFDATGAFGVYYIPGNGNTFGTNSTVAGNVDLRTGVVAAGPSGTLSSPVPIPGAPSAPSAPAVPTIASFSTDSGTAGDHITNDNTLTLTGTAVANSTVNVFDGATPLGTATANASGAWSYTTGSLSNGTHNLTATDTVSGTTSTASTALSVTIDTTAPAAPSIVGNVVSSTNDVTLTGTAEANSTVKVYDGTTQLGTTTANGSGAWSLAKAALPAGNHSFTATATDAAGNTGGASAVLNLTLATPPVNLVANGSFETGDFTGWTLGGNFTGRADLY